MFGFDLGAIAKGLGEGIFTPLASIFNKKTDASIEKYKVDGQLNLEAMKQDTQIIQARADLAKAMKDDPTTKAGRMFFVYPVGIWFGLIIGYCIVQPYFPGYIKPVLAIPGNLEYIPYAVVAYLFVSAWKK